MEDTGGRRSFFRASQSPSMTWLSSNTSRTSALEAKWERTDHCDKSFAFFTHRVSQISSSPSQSNDGCCSGLAPVAVVVLVTINASEAGC